MTGLFFDDAPGVSDAVAIFEIVVGGLLIAGMFLARSGRIRAHMYLQSAMVLVNVPVVLTWMVPQYVDYVLPGLPGEFGEPFYFVPTVMLLLGAAAEVLGIYILLVAATPWVPERFRFRRYKLVMRTELVLWWAVLLTGLTTYYVWYSGGFGS